MIIEREVGEKGQVVIPKDIRNLLGLHKGNKVVFEIKNKEIKIKPKVSTKDFLEEFFNIARTEKNITLKDIKKIEEEMYDLS